MAYVGKKKIKEISYISFVDDVIEKYVDDSTFLKYNPETWQNEVKRINANKLQEILNEAIKPKRSEVNQC